MRFDAHCHAWARWPYRRMYRGRPPTTDLDGLTAVHDAFGVDGGLIVCAAMPADNPAQDNANNNSDVAGWVGRSSRWVQAWDVDSMWSANYHTPDSGERLRSLIRLRRPRVVTHYLRSKNDGWMKTESGGQFFGLLADHEIVLSLHAHGSWGPDLSFVARDFPHLVILLHHLGRPDLDNPEELVALFANAAHSGVHVKVSGAHYLGETRRPNAARELFHRVYDAYGPDRLMWGSDWPAHDGLSTFESTISFVQDAPFLHAEEVDLIMGGNAKRILGGREGAI